MILDIKIALETFIATCLICVIYVDTTSRMNSLKTINSVLDRN